VPGRVAPGVRAHAQVRPHQVGFAAFAHARAQGHDPVDGGQRDAQHGHALAQAGVAEDRGGHKGRGPSLLQGVGLEVREHGLPALEGRGPDPGQAAILVLAVLEVLAQGQAAGVGVEHAAVVVHQQGVLVAQDLDKGLEGPGHVGQGVLQALVVHIQAPALGRAHGLAAQQPQGVIDLLDPGEDQGLAPPALHGLLQSQLLDVAHGLQLAEGLGREAGGGPLHAVNAHERQGQQADGQAEQDHLGFQAHGGTPLPRRKGSCGARFGRVV